jgi:hypothetical protein
MDLLPRNREIDVLTINWTGWRYIGDVLVLAGEDISKMAGSNDGLYVDAKTARKWGNAVLRVLPKLREKRTQSALYDGGYYETPIIYEEAEEEIAGRLLERVYSLDDETKKWLEKFADFCMKSRGFWQY